MNGIETTEGAPVVASAEQNAAPVVAEKKQPAKRKKSAKAVATTIARRQVLAGKHKTTGAPKLDVIGLTKNPLRGPFTLQDVFEKNGKTISLLTIKKRKNELMAAGKLVLDAKAAQRQHEGHGRPPQYFNFDLSTGEVKKSKTRKAKTKGAAAPVVAAEPEQQPAAPAPEQAPVVALAPEQPVAEVPAAPAPVAEAQPAEAPVAA